MIHSVTIKCDGDKEVMLAVDVKTGKASLSMFEGGCVHRATMSAEEMLRMLLICGQDFRATLEMVVGLPKLPPSDSAVMTGDSW